jgi:proline iminopeptidase
MSAHQEKPVLFPDIEPYDSGSLKVSGLHEIYYEQVGSPQGIPLVFLHGGPGVGCSPKHRRYYDPRKFRVILHDQRGAGRSRPFGELRENTTRDLTGDIGKLRAHLGLDRFILLGGSWGSTLALAYAEAHPEHVSGLILRGLYFATKAEKENFYGEGVAAFFPEVTEAYWSRVPEIPGKSRPEQVLALLDNPDPQVRLHAARAWSAYELKMAFLEMKDEDVERELDAGDPTAVARIENHYMAHDCFLEEGELLRGLDRIQDIPAVLVNGRYDVLCPPQYAWRLHKLLPKSKLWIIEKAGHSGGEPGIEAALVQAVRTFE